MIPESIRQYLDDAGVEYVAREHPLAVDGSHLAQALRLTGHRIAKALVVRAGDDRVLVAVPASSRLDLLAISHILGAPAELVDEEELIALFPECEMGAAPPFGKLFKMPMVLDVALAKPGRMVVRGGTHEDAIELDFVDFADLEDPLVAAVSYEGEALAGPGFHQGALNI